MIETLTTNNANVSADADREINIINVGTDGVFVSGNMFEASIIDNNTIRLKDGILIQNGAYLRIVEGTNEDMTIDNGVTGVDRTDLIVAHFESDGINETHDIRVLKNTEVATDNDLILYKVVLNGINIQSVQPQFKKIMSIKQMQDALIAIVKDMPFWSSANAQTLISKLDINGGN